MRWARYPAWYPDLKQISDQDFEGLDHSAVGIPAVYNSAGKLWPQPIPAFDPYAWRSTSELDQ